MATIFGSNLADTTVVISPPWINVLGGTEVHLADDNCFDSSCDLIASLIYVSPTQINFLVPESASSEQTGYRFVLIRDGQRFDNRMFMLGGPGYIYIDPYYDGDYNVVFEVGYDCLFSFSLIDPVSCGLSWTPGNHRALSGAVTDAISWQLISSQNPVHQGQLITLWVTGLQSGSVRFGVAQLGNDIPATVTYGMEGQYGTFLTPAALWAGESPQYVGLDQVNVAFPTCDTGATAVTERRYDAFLMYTSIETGTTERIYVPFIVRSGDPDCQW
jgi:hypothetical protein